MSAPRPTIERRREEFIAYLRGLGAGDECVYVPWLRIHQHGRQPDYGRLMVGRKRITAHRWVYIQIVGPVPDDWEVCHFCDNPPCVRPSHLWAGTTSQNALDAFAKGRRKAGPGMRGENHGMAKLSDVEVGQIRVLLVKGSNRRLLAQAFGVSKSQIGRIARGEARRDSLKPRQQ